MEFMKNLASLFVALLLPITGYSSSWKASPIDDPMSDTKTYEAGIVNRDNRQGIMKVFGISEAKNKPSGYFTIMMRFTPAELIHGKNLKIRVDSKPVNNITGTNRLREEDPSSGVAVRVDFNLSCPLIHQLANGNNLTVQWNATATTKKHETFSLSGSEKALRKGTPSCFKGKGENKSSKKEPSNNQEDLEFSEDIYTCTAYYELLIQVYRYQEVNHEVRELLPKYQRMKSTLEDVIETSKNKRDKTYNEYLEEVNKTSIAKNLTVAIQKLKKSYEQRCEKYFENN